MAGQRARESCEGIVVRIVTERGTVIGKIREPAILEDSIVVRVDDGPHPWAGQEIPVPKKHARAPVATGDRVQLVWPADQRRSNPDIYRVSAK